MYRNLTAEEAHQWMSELTGYLLLDVRTEEEYLERRIEGAVLIPDYELAHRAEAEIADKETIILIYCRSGRRSVIAAQILSHMGYGNIYNFGGIIDWPYDTVSG